MLFKEQLIFEVKFNYEHIQTTKNHTNIFLFINQY
jgi:hypothetical protein